MRKILFIVVAVAVIGVALAVLLPAFTARQPVEKRGAILNNLRQLDAAKQQWMLETKAAPDRWPSSSDLSAYINLVEPISDEVYIINRADRPVAVYFPKDTQIRQWHFRGGLLFTMDDLQHYYDDYGKSH